MASKPLGLFGNCWLQLRCGVRDELHVRGGATRSRVADLVAHREFRRVGAAVPRRLTIRFSRRARCAARSSAPVGRAAELRIR